MKTKSILILVVSAWLMSGCGKSSTTAETQPATMETNEELKAVLTGYFQVKDALVSDDAAKAKEAATVLVAATGNYANALNESLQTIASTDDIEAQRTAFETLSMNLYNVAKNGGTGITVYKQFCPMAFDDKGAFWLSDSKQVMNPYFGASMLKCGSVQEEIK